MKGTTFVYVLSSDWLNYWFDTLTKIKPEYSDILYNPTNYPGPLVCRIRNMDMEDLVHDL
jgi:TATA-box binding protein (TBP) (component of TFIID and TFIIIB)